MVSPVRLFKNVCPFFPSYWRTILILEMIVVAFDLVRSTHVVIYLCIMLIEMFPCPNLKQYTTSSEEIMCLSKHQSTKNRLTYAPRPHLNLEAINAQAYTPIAKPYAQFLKD